MMSTWAVLDYLSTHRIAAHVASEGPHDLPGMDFPKIGLCFPTTYSCLLEACLGRPMNLHVKPIVVE